MKWFLCAVIEKHVVEWCSISLIRVDLGVILTGLEVTVKVFNQLLTIINKNKPKMFESKLVSNRLLNRIDAFYIYLKLKMLFSNTNNSNEHNYNLRTVRVMKWIKLRRLRVYLGVTNLLFFSIEVLHSKPRTMLPHRGKGFGPIMYDFSLLYQYKQLYIH